MADAPVVDMNEIVRSRMRGGRKIENTRSASAVNRLIRGQGPAPSSPVALEEQDLERLSVVRRDDPAVFAALHPDVRSAVITYDAGDPGGAA